MYKLRNYLNHSVLYSYIEKSSPARPHPAPSKSNQSSRFRRTSVACGGYGACGGCGGCVACGACGASGGRGGCAGGGGSGSSGGASPSAADGMVCSRRGGGSAAGDGGGSSPDTAGWRVSRGRAPPALPPERVVRHVPVDAVALEPDESLRDDDRFESCDVLRATSHDAARRGGGGARPHARHESERDEENSTDDDTEPARAGAAPAAVRARGAAGGGGRAGRVQARSQRSRRRGRAGAGAGSRRRHAHAQAGPCGPRDERSARLLVLAGVCRLLKLDEWRQRPMPRVTRDSSMALHTSAQSFLNCLVRIAYRNGLQHEFSGSTNTVSTFRIRSA